MQAGWITGYDEGYTTTTAMGKKRKTNNKDATTSSKKQAKQATPRAPSGAPAASPSSAGGMSDALLNMKFMRKSAEKASPAPAAPAVAAPAAVTAEPAERPLFGRRSFGGFNREMEKNEASFYRAHGLRYNEPADAPKAAAALDFGAYSQGRRKDKSTNARTR